MSSRLMISAAAAVALLGSTMAASAQMHHGYAGGFAGEGHGGYGSHGGFAGSMAYADGPIYYSEPGYGYDYSYSPVNRANGWTNARRGPNFYRLPER